MGEGSSWEKHEFLVSFATFKDNTICSLIFLLFVTFSYMLPFGALTVGCITNN